MLPSSPPLPCRALKITSTPFLGISVIDENFGSNLITLYFNCFKALIQDMPVSRLTSRSLDRPPRITKTLFFFNNFISFQ